MTDEILAYLMDDLPPERRAAIEEKLATDFAWQRERRRIEQCLADCGDPCKCAEEPPVDLVDKTCHLVENSDEILRTHREAKQKRRESPTPVFSAAASCGCDSRRWSLVDLTVGGGVLAMVALLVIPAVFESRDAARRNFCQNNLRTFGGALFKYQENNGNHLPAIGPTENAGRYAVELLEHGLLTREQLQQLLVCPESPLAADLAAGRVTLVLPSREALESASGEQLAAWLKSMGGSYAYRVGYFDEGEYREVMFTGDARSPLMADAPGLSPHGVQIVNHAGGQNVLDQGLGVRFRTQVVDGDNRDHIFLNFEGEHAAGRGPKDIALIRSEYGPNGPIVPVENDEIRMTNDE
jgi:hypothetical protein